MKVIKNLEVMLEEHLQVAHGLDENEFETLYTFIEKSNKIFISAAGRSFLQMKGFAMRLMHLDYNVEIVGDITTSAIKNDDLLIVASGSGETQGILNQAIKAKKLGAHVFAITQNETSSISKEAQARIIIPKVETIQPGGTQFEQFLGMCMDSFILGIMKEKQLPLDYVYKNHANLE